MEHIQYASSQNALIEKLCIFFRYLNGSKMPLYSKVDNTGVYIIERCYIMNSWYDVQSTCMFLVDFLTKQLHLFHHRYWNNELQRAKRGQTPRLWFVILQCFKWRLLIHGLLFITLVSSTNYKYMYCVLN